MLIVYSPATTCSFVLIPTLTVKFVVPFTQYRKQDQQRKGRRVGRSADDAFTLCTAFFIRGFAPDEFVVGLSVHRGHRFPFAYNVGGISAKHLAAIFADILAVLSDATSNGIGHTNDEEPCSTAQLEVARTEAARLSMAESKSAKFHTRLESSIKSSKEPQRSSASLNVSVSFVPPLTQFALKPHPSVAKYQGNNSPISRLKVSVYVKGNVFLIVTGNSAEAVASQVF